MVFPVYCGAGGVVTTDKLDNLEGYVGGSVAIGRAFLFRIGGETAVWFTSVWGLYG
jgi:hypothetical protein